MNGTPPEPEPTPEASGAMTRLYAAQGDVRREVVAAANAERAGADPSSHGDGARLASAIDRAGGHRRFVGDADGVVERPGAGD
jgi:hypothetical protein